MEYTGDPFEKLLGFFIAVVILTFYLGIVNLLLMFASFSLFNGNAAGYWVSFVGVIPLWFYARYRARRYILGRTRWRGVRFAMEPAAWRYTLQALKHWVFTILSAGLLWPRMTFYLEKFRTDRTFFGDARLSQGGRWQMLIPATYPFVAALLATGLFGLWIVYWQPVFSAAEGEVSKSVVVGVWSLINDEQWFDVTAQERLYLIPVLLFALLYGAIHYASMTKRIMANHKSANGVKLTSQLSPLRIFMIYNFGYTLAYLVLVAGISLLILSMIPLFGLGETLAIFGEGGARTEPVSSWISVPLTVLLYFSIFLLWSVFFNVFVTFPLMRHRATTLALIGPAALAAVSQRKHDQFAEAEGFAEALDLGAAI